MHVPYSKKCGPIYFLTKKLRLKNNFFHIVFFIEWLNFLKLYLIKKIKGKNNLNNKIDFIDYNS